VVKNALAGHSNPHSHSYSHSISLACATKKTTVDKSNENSISLNKYISQTGICSRREADAMIEHGRVTINGEPTKKGNRVFEGDVVLIDGKPLLEKPETIYIAFNKPLGVVCTTDLKEPDNIIDFIDHPERLFPVGRLDKFSQGLIFLTNDGDIVNKILRAGNNHEKEYVVSTRQPITDSFVKQMAAGVPVLDTITKKCQVTKMSEHTFKITLTQGINRQIRRMCEYLDYSVTHLMRTRIMSVNLGTLKSGHWRELTEEEIQNINKAIANSSKTEEASRDIQ